MDFFKGKKAVIATKHKKEKVIAPIFEDELGLICVTPNGLDTDQLGTFSGEVKRLDDTPFNFKKKYQMTIKASGISVAIANEGLFGAHPTFFCTCRLRN